MQKFDPANPPRRKIRYVITDSEGVEFEHFVTAVPVGLIDRILEIGGEMWGKILTTNPGTGNISIDAMAVRGYANEVVEILSLMTGYEEEDIRKWDSDVLLEMFLDWIDGNIKRFQDTWSKKKGALGDLFGKEETAKEVQKEEPKIPLSQSEAHSGSTSDQPITGSDSLIQKSTE